MIQRKYQKAQAVAEYAITIALITFTVMTMTVFIKRLLQARMRDAHVYMLSEVRKVQSDVPYTYEPYYTISDSDILRKSADSSVIDGVGPAAVEAKSYYGQETTTNTVSQQLPPKDAQ